MFCPRCGTENGSEQGYCRQCGLPLSAVNLALEGQVDRAAVTLGKGSGNLSAGVIIFVIGLLNALLNVYFDAWQSAAVSAALGSAAGVPLMAAGLARVRSAKRLLSPGEAAGGLPGAGKAVGGLQSEEPTRALGTGQTAPGSVTEHTTLRLDASEPASRK